MLGILKQLFGGGGVNQEIQQALDNGAIIVDVRTPAEFSSGHVKGSKNIPLNQIESQAKKIKGWKKPIVVCCASGMRSASAKGILAGHGIEVYNAGSWASLNK